MYDVVLKKCSRTDYEYKEIRDRHYIPNNGAIGQQLHYLVRLKEDGKYKTVGIISAGSAAYAVKARDEFFGITNDNRRTALNGIVDNTVFRLEVRMKNLGTQVLSMWQKQVQKDWYAAYGVNVAGFETFIIENEQRKGAMYKADNWTFVGETSGSTKKHNHGIGKVSERQSVCKKLVFCKWVKGGVLPSEYEATWSTPGVIKGQITMDEILATIGREVTPCNR